MAVLPRTKMSVEEYLAYDAAHEGKHEYADGVMRPMDGAPPVHNLLTANLSTALHARLASGPCTTLSSRQRVHVDETDLYVYPDITVVCGRPEFLPTEPPTLANPSLIVEVLSPTTGAWDKDGKFAHYRRRPSVQAVVFVSWPDRRIEHYRRHDGGEWLLTEASGHGASIALPTLGIEVPLDEVYDGMDEYLAALAATPSKG